MPSAASAREQGGAEGKHVGAVVFAGVAGERAVGAHGRPHAVNLVGGHGRAQAGAVDRDAGIGFAAGHEARHGAGDVGVIHRVGRVEAHLLHRQTAARAGDRAARGAGPSPYGRCRVPPGAPGSPAPGCRRRRARRRAPAMMRRSRRVSSANGVTWPPLASVMVEPRSRVRAMVSVIMSKSRHLGVLARDTAPLCYPRRSHAGRRHSVALRRRHSLADRRAWPSRSAPTRPTPTCTSSAC